MIIAYGRDAGPQKPALRVSAPARCADSKPQGLRRALGLRLGAARFTLCVPGRDVATRSTRKQLEWTEFDCPECSAHNPWDDGFTFGDEVFCSWCGCRLKVRKAGEDGDRFKLVVD